MRFFTLIMYCAISLSTLTLTSPFHIFPLLFNFSIFLLTLSRSDIVSLNVHINYFCTPLLSSHPIITNDEHGQISICYFEFVSSNNSKFFNRSPMIISLCEYNPNDFLFSICFLHLLLVRFFIISLLLLLFRFLLNSHDALIFSLLSIFIYKII
jgi:hypothetical protein